jgi:peptide deformylase
MNEVLKIVQTGDEVLRGKAEEVPHEEIGSEKIQSLIKKMRKTLAEEEDGVGLAAPQVGEPLRIFIVSKKALSKDGSEKQEDLVFINPVISKQSRKKELMDEGCLSVRGKYGNVNRFTRVTVSAYNEKGKKIERGAGGLLSQIFQHEVDHLDGVLFTDKTKMLKELSDE